MVTFHQDRILWEIRSGNTIGWVVRIGKWLWLWDWLWHWILTEWLKKIDLINFFPSFWGYASQIILREVLPQDLLRVLAFLGFYHDSLNEFCEGLVALIHNHLGCMTGHRGIENEGDTIIYHCMLWFFLILLFLNDRFIEFIEVRFLTHSNRFFGRT